jgi:hypothetical protein
VENLIASATQQQQQELFASLSDPVVAELEKLNDKMAKLSETLGLDPEKLKEAGLGGLPSLISEAIANKESPIATALKSLEQAWRFKVELDVNDIRVSRAEEKSEAEATPASPTSGRGNGPSAR